MAWESGVQRFLPRLLLGTILVLYSNASLAEPPAPSPEVGWGSLHFFEQNADRLGLDAATLAEIQAISERHEKRTQELRERIQQERSRIRTLLTEPSPDDEAVMAQAEALGALELEEKKNHLAALLGTRALLDHEQQEEMFRIREERAALYKRKRGPLRACRKELRKLCPEASDPAASRACLARNPDKLSERCEKAMGAPSAARATSRKPGDEPNPPPPQEVPAP